MARRTAMAAMSEDDVNEAARMFYAGMIPLRAAAWCLLRRRAEEGIELTSSDLADRLGIHAKSASRTLGELRRFALLDAPGTTKTVAGEVTISVTSDDCKVTNLVTGTHQRVTEMVTPPEPPYKDSGIDRERLTDGAVTNSVTCSSHQSEDISRARAVLAGNIQTEPLAGALSRSAHLDRVRALASDGWRLESAARKFLDPCEVGDDIRARRNTDSQLKYLLRIAENLSEPYEPRPVVPMRATGTAGPPPRYVPPSVARREEQRARNQRLIAEAEARERAEASGVRREDQHHRSEHQR
jgi:hypothetical protein